MSKPKPASNTSFEDAMAELEAIVSRMESGALPLQESLATYKRGGELLKFCQQSLAEAEQQVRILTDNNQLQEYKPADD